MPKTLVIVESPTKARTISRFLGSDFVVDSSFGHIRDLPSSKLGVDIEHNFEPQYIIPLKARATVKKLKEEAAHTERTILATDEDREGEAIAWHLIKALGLDEIKNKNAKIKNIERIVFHEITKKAIEEALKNPRAINTELVDAQQARRILDRLVGYKLSPFLWKKVYRGLSAGRVQSVAVRLVVEREREIQNFKPHEYWTIIASLEKQKVKNKEQKMNFEAYLIKMDGEALDKFAIKNQEDAEKIVRDAASAEWKVASIEKRAVSKNPLPPFTTSTLQQEAFRKLGFSAKQTMVLAQQLYEGIELGEQAVGLITYMRTDSVNLSEDSLLETRAFLKKEVGETYALPSPRRFQTKTKSAQEAHEAIRPTDPWRSPDSIKDFLERRQWRLYDLIWRRFIATQMPSAIFDATSIDITAKNYIFRATGQTIRFDGFLKIYPAKFTEAVLPDCAIDEELALKELKPLQHFTEPSPRYSEATLVKTLEQNGIGRPSTYAPTISTIQERGYVEKHERRYLKPTEIGFIVNDLLVEHFPKIVDIQFTAKMEKELDEIAAGEKQWQPVIKEFYEPFAKHLEEKYQEVKKLEAAEITDEVCEKCGRSMAVKFGRFGKFLACSGFPECKSTKPLGEKQKAPPQEIGMKCPKCTEGEVIIRYTRRRKIFYGCSRYPKCDWASWENPQKQADQK